MGNKEGIIGLIILTIILVLALMFTLNFLTRDLPTVAKIAPPEKPLFQPQGVEYHGNDIQTSYSGGDTISGSVNLSFDNFPVESLLTSNFEGSISLEEFLGEQLLVIGGDYNCTPPNCQQGFAPQSAISNLVMGGSEKIAGFSISGADVNDILTVQFNVASNVGPSTYTQLYMDILDKGENYLINTETTGNVSSYSHRGCYNPNANQELATITTTPYCENMSLPLAPSFVLGAKIVDSTTVSAQLKMILKDTDTGEVYGQCDLPQPSQVTQELTCVVDYSPNVIREYLVCIRVDNNAANYKLNTETQNPKCGMDEFGNPANIDYDVFARTMEFAALNMLVNNQVFEDTTGIDLNNYIEDYIFENFDGNCQPNCVIPISFNGLSQTLVFSNVILEYKQGITQKETNTLFNVDIVEPLVNSGELELDLREAGFTIPLGSNENEFEFFIENELVFDENIAIAESFDFDVNPKFVTFGQNVLFTASATGEVITGSSWKFGDGSSDNSNTNQIAYRYLVDGQIKMEVTLKNANNNTSTKTFSIVVGNAQDYANLTIAEYKLRIADLETKIGTFPGWISNEINKLIDVVGLKATLTSIENDFKLAQTDEDYQSVVLSLVALDIPKSLTLVNGGTNIPLEIGFNNWDISYIEDISGDIAENEDALRINIGGWMNQYFSGKIKYDYVTAMYDEGNDVLMTVYDVDTNPIEQPKDVSNLIFGTDIVAGGGFRTSYGERQLGGGTYIPLEIGEVDKKIEFYLIGEFMPEELGIYISPTIDRLGDTDPNISPCNFNDKCEKDIGEDKDNCPADCGAGRWGWFTFWVIFMIFIALIIYIVMQEWYKRYYENFLFKSKTDLYNLINFIYNARRAGITNREAKKKLREVNWKGEQITYAFKKIDGKRIGMYEIPVLKFMENRKGKKELEKRQGGKKVDLRFVKGSSF
jgi:hypothetical protein